MNRYLKWIKEYFKFFLILLGLLFLFQELWNWFEDDSLLRNAGEITIAIMIFNFVSSILKKFNKRKDKTA